MKRTALYDLSTIRDGAVAACHLCLVPNSIYLLLFFYFFFLFPSLSGTQIIILLSHKESRTEHKQTLSRRCFKRAPSNAVYSIVVKNNLQVDRN